MRDELIAEYDDRVEGGDGEDQPERRQQTARAADPERAQVDALLSIELPTSSAVIRNPLTTKNTSTPRNPAGSQNTPAW